MADHDSKPAELSEAQIDALADAGNRALNDHYHEDLCSCSAWPEGCVSSGSYFAGSWDTAAFHIGMAAVIGAWEAMRAPAAPVLVDDERTALIRKRRTHCEATQGETEDERPLHVWGPSQCPGREMCQRCTTERAWAEDTDADDVVLLAEVDRLLGPGGRAGGADPGRDPDVPSLRRWLRPRPAVQYLRVQGADGPRCC